MPLTKIILLFYILTGGTATMENTLSYMIPRGAFSHDLLYFVNNFLLDSYTKKRMRIF